MQLGSELSFMNLTCSWDEAGQESMNNKKLMDSIFEVRWWGKSGHNDLKFSVYIPFLPLTSTNPSYMPDTCNPVM